MESMPSQRPTCSASCRTTSRTKTPVRSAWVSQLSDKVSTRAWVYRFRVVERRTSRCSSTAVALRRAVWLFSSLFSLAARSSRLAAHATSPSSRLWAPRRLLTTTTRIARRRSASTRMTSSLVSSIASPKESRRKSAQRRFLPRVARSRTSSKPSTIVLMSRTRSVQTPLSYRLLLLTSSTGYARLHPHWRSFQVGWRHGHAREAAGL